MSFQLTRSRGAWLFPLLILRWIVGISTHTLTWSVTFVKKFCKKCLRISTHTLTWSVTKQVADDLKEYSDFNSHAHVERDATILILWNQKCISTHTLTWSVTHNTQIFVNPHKFQLTRSRGAWRSWQGAERNEQKISTHTLTWSVTCVVWDVSTKRTDFNSHAHVERDFSPSLSCGG